MKILTFLLLFLIINLTANGQDCSCNNDFSYVVNFIEQNFPGFDKNVTEKNRKDYEEYKTSIYKKINKVETKNECLKYLTYFVEYFKDNHTKMRYTGTSKPVNESSEKELIAFLKSIEYQDTETFKLTKNQLKQYPVNDIRGIYTSSDSTYTIAVVENKTAFRDYIGVVIESKTKLWMKGQLKLELKKKQSNVYEGFVYNKYHNPNYKTIIPFNDGFLDDIWIKTNKENRINYSVNSDKKFFHTVKDSTVLLRIPSFMEGYTNKIDSLYVAAKTAIETHPYLIIDVRNNGGGNSSNFNKLIPFLYTKPIIDSEVVELYATKDIIKLYEDEFNELMKDSTQVNTETIKAFKEGIQDLKKAKPNSFVRQGEDLDSIILSPLKYPKKVAIVYNSGCASACEDLLFKAKHSDKTILLGDNSGGFVGYGNIFTVYTPCYKLGLSCSTTRYSTQWQYEVIGITPDKKLDYNNDWIEQAIEILKK